MRPLSRHGFFANPDLVILGYGGSIVALLGVNALQFLRHQSKIRASWTVNTVWVGLRQLA